MKRQRSYVGIVVILILIAAAAGLITFLIERKMPSKEREDLSLYYSLKGEDSVGLTVDGIVSAEPLTKAGDKLYAPYETVKGLLNKRFYYDADARLLSVTTPTECQNFALDDLLSSGDALAMETAPDGDKAPAGFGLALPFLESWTDMAVTTGGAEGDPDDVPRVSARLTFPYEEAPLLEAAPIRTRPTVKAPILTDKAAGDVLTIVKTEDNAEGWTPVMTADGLSGYVESEALGERAEAGADHVSAIGTYTSLSLGQKVNMAFYQTDNDIMTDDLGNKLARGVSGINVVTPTWFFLDGPGEVRSLCKTEFVETCHANGYQVWALINDIDGNVTSSSDVAAVLGSTPSRQAIVQTIIDTVLSCGIDGVNVDIERVSTEGVDAYLTFIRELSAKCRANGLFLSVDTYVPMAYSRYLDRHEQGIVADYVVIMCYDEHYSGSEEAGSVASQTYLEDGIANTKKEVPAEKIIAAIPFYTRLWATRDDGAPTSDIFTMGDAIAYANDHGMTVYWDETVCQHVAELDEDGVFYQMWLEDADSVAAKMEAIRDSGIAGVAEWRMGNEIPEVWAIIASYLQ